MSSRRAVAILVGFAATMACATAIGPAYESVYQILDLFIPGRPRGWLPRFVSGVIAVGLLSLPGIIIAVAIVARNRSDNETRCRACGYILRGLPEPRCPECGTTI